MRRFAPVWIPSRVRERCRGPGEGLEGASEEPRLLCRRCLGQGRGLALLKGVHRFSNDTKQVRSHSMLAPLVFRDGVGSRPPYGDHARCPRWLVFARSGNAASLLSRREDWGGAMSCAGRCTCRTRPSGLTLLASLLAPLPCGVCSGGDSSTAAAGRYFLGSNLDRAVLGLRALNADLKRPGLSMDGLGVVPWAGLITA